MSRTVFVNPSFINPGRKKKGGKRRGKKARKGARRRRYQVMHGRVALMPIRRNAGIAPFVQQNPLILANPVKRRRRRRSNPSLSMGGIKTAAMSALSYGGGAGLALGANTLAISHIANPWLRRATQLGLSVVGAGLIDSKSKNMAGAFAGAMMYPLLQDVAGDLLSGVAAAVGGTAHEADIDALAADLEDVMDEMSDDDMSDDDAGEYF